MVVKGFSQDVEQCSPGGDDRPPFVKERFY